MGGKESIIVLDGEFAGEVLEQFDRDVKGLAFLGQFNIVVDLKKVSWTSLKALKSLVDWDRRLREQKGSLTLRSVNPYLMNLMELTGTMGTLVCEGVSTNGR